MVNRSLRTYFECMPTINGRLQRPCTRYNIKACRQKTTCTGPRAKILHLQSSTKPAHRQPKETQVFRINNRAKTYRERTRNRPLRIIPEIGKTKRDRLFFRGGTRAVLFSQREYNRHNKRNERKDRYNYLQTNPV